MDELDIKILKIKEDIISKEKELKNKGKISLITSCTIELYGKTYNLNTLNKNDLSILLINLSLINKERINLNLEEIEINGYCISDWIKDIKSKIENINNINKKNELNKAKKELDNLLSVDAKRKENLDNIIKSIG